MVQASASVEAGAPLLAVNGLSLALTHGGRPLVDNVSFSLAPGEIVAIVGESGSGKTLTARAIIGLEPPAVRRSAGSIIFEGRDVTTMTPDQLRELRGNRIGFVFQEPMTSLNPSMRIGRQMEEGLILHTTSSADGRRDRMVDMLKRVGITDPDRALNAYPHEFSGGMRQRIMLASVMLLKPSLVIADEPTTALDAVVQRDVLDLMVDLTRDYQTAVLMISHDLPMVAGYTRHVIVMSEGKVVEQGPTADLLAAPKHPYSRKLLSAMPRRLPARPPSEDRPVVEVENLIVDYASRFSLFSRGAAAHRALHGISLQVRPRETLAVVGGSGSGKTTLGRAIAGLLKPSDGSIRFRGRPIAKGEAGWSDYRSNCQMVFQDPYSSLDPRMIVSQLVAEALRTTSMTSAEKRERVTEVLEEVGLGATFAERYPHELSGGQRQRIAIARAVVRRPAFVIADEPVSALDVTVRAQILKLFAELQDRHGFSCLFISHDLGVVEQVADRVIVMHQGRIVEEGTRDSIFDHPAEAYTRRLLSAIPFLETTASGGVEVKWRKPD